MSCLYSPIIQPRPIKPNFIDLFSPYNIDGLIYLLAIIDLELMVILSYLKFLESGKRKRKFRKTEGCFLMGHSCVILRLPKKSDWR